MFPRTTAALFLPLLLCPALVAQDAAPPKAEVILDRFVEVTGGKDAYARIKNRSATGTIEMVGAGLKGDVKVLEAPEAKNITSFELQGIGKIEQGTDGVVAWQRSVIGGDKVLKGEERDQQIRSAYFNGDVHWQKVFKDAKTIGAKRVGDRMCWEVAMTTPEGLVFTKYFDQKTGLLVMMKVTVKTDAMEVPTETYPADWQKIDGILYPFEMRIKAMSQEMVMRLNKVEHNVPLPAETFELPKEIKAIIDRSK